jgi:mono/diheme cytochrome c family protein
MSTMKRLSLMLLCTLAACNDDNTNPNVNVVRGKYLVQTVLACGDCHTTPQANGLPSFDPSDFLAGGREFDVPVGANTQKFFAKNLTSDKETGIGGWSDAQIKRAITKGIDDQGKALFPVMPYFVFGNMKDEDLSAIVLFLRTLPPQKNDVPEDTLAIDTPATVIDATQVPHTSLSPGDKRYESAERGRYIAGLMGACIDCHTPHGTSFDKPLQLNKAFSGGEPFDLGTFTIASANLTPDLTGLAGWSTDDVIATVQFAKERGTGRAICPPMPAGPNRDGDMTPTDLKDIANYLTTLSPIPHGPFGCSDGGAPIGLDAL